MGSCGLICRRVLEWKNFFIVVLLPIVLLPLPIVGQSSVARCAYAVLIIGVYWVLEVMPIAVTSLIPVFIFPLLGIMPSSQVCRNYANDTLMLFFGSLVVAAAVERWNLHKRIALRALTLVGPEPRWLMLGIMLPTWFLSMWMSNTATTAMMIPILNAILSQIKAVQEKVLEDEIPSETTPLHENGSLSEKPKKKEVEITVELDNILEPGHPVTYPVNIREPERRREMRTKQEVEFQQLAKTFALCTAYAANAGGVATLTGTPPNIILKGQADILYEQYHLPSAITFANWLIVGIPLSFMVFMATWIWLQVYALGKKCLCCIKNEEDYSVVKQHLLREYRGLGPMTFAEKVVLADFIILALLWILRNPVFIPGWGSFFQDKYVADSTAAIFMSVVLFFLPSQLPKFSEEPVQEKKEDELTANHEYVPLLTWKFVNDKMAWGVLLLMGGGFAVADGCAESGLSEWLSDQLTVFAGFPYWVTSAFLAYITAAITNVTSNAATATLFLPIVGSLAIKLSVHPLYFMIPCALAASFAFMLPVGTPPNAIVFSTGYLNIPDMMKAGSVINFVSVLIMCVCLNAFIMPVFDLYTIPAAFLANTTTATTGTVVAGVVDTLAYNVTSSVT